MSLWRGIRIVVRRLIKIPRDSSIGIQTKKVDLFTCTGFPAAEAGTKPPLPLVRVVDKFISISKGLVPSGSSPGVLVDIGVVGCFSKLPVESVAYSLYWALRIERCGG